MYFYFAVHGMDKKDESNKSLSLFECFDLPKDFSQRLNASQDAQSGICSCLYRDKQYWYVDKHIKGGKLTSFDPTGNYFAVGYKDNSVKLFTLTLEKMKYKLPVHIHNDILSILKFDPTGRYLATGCMDGTVRIFEAASGKLICMPQGDRRVYEDPIEAFEFDSTGKHLAIIDQNKKVRIVECESGKLIHRLPDETDYISLDEDGHMIVTKKTKYSSQLFTSRSTMNSSQLYFLEYFYDSKNIDYISFYPKGECRAAIEPRDQSMSQSCIFDPTGKYLVTVYYDKVEVFEVSSKKLLCVLDSGSNTRAITFDPTGRYLAVRNCTWEGVRIFQIPSGRLVDLIIHRHTVNSVCFDSTGEYLTIGCSRGKGLILTQYHQWTLKQKLLLKMFSTWVCIEKPHSSIKSINALLKDVSSKYCCDLVELQNILKTFPEKMVSSIWEKMKHKIKVYGKKTAKINR